MKKFHYRLQKLLQLKEHHKLQQQKELAKAERVRRMEEAHQRMLREQLDREVSSLHTVENAQLNIARFGRSVYYQQRLNANMATQETVIANAEKLEDESRQRLIEATKNEKIYQRLKEKQLETYLQELERLEQKETDEIAGNVGRRRDANKDANRDACKDNPKRKNPRQD